MTIVLVIIVLTLLSLAPTPSDQEGSCPSGQVWEPIYEECVEAI